MQMTSLNLKHKTLYLSILLLLTACTTPTVIINSQNQTTITVEIADEPAEHSQGLMHRDFLPENHGMLFVFNETKPLTFWMKNTKIKLDIIFISNKTIIDIKQNFQPCEQEPCEKYTSLPANKVLEVNAGFVQEKMIMIGTNVTF
mgnify:CR=1 FL=1